MPDQVAIVWQWTRENSTVIMLIVATIGFVVQAEVRIAQMESRVKAIEIQQTGLSQWRSGVDVDIATIKAQIESIDSTTRETRHDVKQLLQR